MEREERPVKNQATKACPLCGHRRLSASPSGAHLICSRCARVVITRPPKRRPGTQAQQGANSRRTGPPRGTPIPVRQKVSDAVIAGFMAEGMSVTEIAHAVGLTRPSILMRVRRLQLYPQSRPPRGQ